VTHTASVRVAITVNLEPAAAFDVFTMEIDQWYKRGRHSFADPRRAVGIRFEPGVGGRLIEVYDESTGDGRTMGRIEVWEPGVRLMFVDSHRTEVDVTFVPDGDGTRVCLEHRGLERLRPDLADRHGRFGGRLLIAWYAEYVRQPTDNQGSDT
jgi:hypothetical protein